MALLGLLAAGAAFGATPAPDPPPLPAPDPPVRTQPVRTQPVQTQPTAPRPAPAPAPRVAPRTVVVTVATPQAAAPTRNRATPVQPGPKPAVKAQPKPAARPKAAATPVARVPHDRGRVPLAAFVPAAEELDRGLLTVAALALLLAALGGAVVLGAARRQLLAATVGLFALVGAPAVLAQTPPVSYTLVGTSGENGWHTSSVTIRWVLSEPASDSQGCPNAELISGEGVHQRQCRATFSWGTVTSPVVTIKIDKTAPNGISGALQRGPDANGWYNSPVGAGFSGDDGVSGIDGCSSPTYSGGDSGSAMLSGTCKDKAGNTSSAASITFKYDATPPTVGATADKPPVGGWYRAPLVVTFGGSDATSGIAACTAPIRYRGPDGPSATVKGTCSDAAGNAAEAAYAFNYDASAPKLGKPTVSRGPGQIAISWPASAEFASIQLVRSPGLRGKASSVVYAGKRSTFVDKSVTPGRRYRYQLVVADVAGNKSGRVVTAGPLAPLYLPGAGATLRAPPLLRWQSVAGARFYNVQLYRGKKKILSAWPKGASLRLARTWLYAGARQRLVPGVYRWYVWGAKGTRERPVYGRALGSSTFRIGR